MAPWLRKRDGTLSYGFKNPDGSWVELPPEDEEAVQTAPLQEHVQAVAPSTAGNVRQFLRSGTRLSSHSG